MDKKKVIELIKKGMLYQSKSSHVSSYKEKAKNCFEESLDELQKPDWISVEDDLPPYGKNVFVKSKNGYSNVTYRRKIAREKISRDIMDDNGFVLHFNLRGDEITHWRKIDKLEV